MNVKNHTKNTKNLFIFSTSYFKIILDYLRKTITRQGVTNRMIANFSRQEYISS